MYRNQLDQGLIRVVTWRGLAASIVNAVVGSGIFVVPAALAASIGAYAPLAFVVCAIGVGSVAICFAEGGSRIPASGGPYAYIEAALGPLAGYVAGTLLWFGNVLSCAAIDVAFANIVVSLLPPSVWVKPAHAAVVAAVVGGFALANVAGARRGARLVETLTVVKLIPLLIFIVAGAGAINFSNYAQTVPPSSNGLGRALILALFALMGMEIPLAASGEIEQPARAIPRALAAALLPVVLLYVAVQLILQGTLGAPLARSAAPLADAMAGIGPALKFVMLAGTAVAMFGWIGSDLLGTPRVLFALARAGTLPRVLSRVHPKYRTPHIAIWCYAVIAFVLAVSGTFAELAALGALATAALYVLSCAAACRLSRRAVALAGAPLNFKRLGSAVVIGAGSMLVLIALADWAEIFGLIVVLVLSACIYLVQVRLRERAAAVR